MKFNTLAEFYNGRHILITGATGFMGKVMLEKLLRSFPKVGKIYLLIRSKKGQQSQARLDAMLGNPIFEKVRSENAAVLHRLRVVSGDVTDDGLGIDDPVLRDEMLRSVSVVFHFAACVRFDMKLKHALEFNTKGTKRVLQISETMEKLEAFVYVSTSYCHCDEVILEEEVYNAPFDPDKLISSIEWMDDDLVELMTPKLIGNLPNTYAFSKCLSEKYVADASPGMPVAIARPSIVSSAWQEPLPGFVDNLNGPSGLFVGACMGILRSMHCKPTYKADLIPVDLACNGIIATAWELSNNRPECGPLVVHLTSSQRNPVSWGEIIEHCRKFVFIYPFSRTVWWPGGNIKSSKLVHDFCFYSMHIIPAYVIDGLAVLFRHRPFMLKIQKRLQGGLDLLQYYTTKEWHFTNNKIVSICEKLQPEERECFNTDVKSIQWDTYVKDMLLGLRLFILKDDPSTLPKARRHMDRLYWLDRGFKLCLYALLFWILYSYLELFVWIFTGVGNFFK